MFQSSFSSSQTSAEHVLSAHGGEPKDCPKVLVKVTEIQYVRDFEIKGRKRGRQRKCLWFSCSSSTIQNLYQLFLCKLK